MQFRGKKIGFLQLGIAMAMINDALKLVKCISMMTSNLYYGPEILFQIALSYDSLRLLIEFFLLHELWARSSTQVQKWLETRMKSCYLIVINRLNKLRMQQTGRT